MPRKFTMTNSQELYDRLCLYERNTGMQGPLNVKEYDPCHIVVKSDLFVLNDLAREFAIFYDSRDGVVLY